MNSRRRARFTILTSVALLAAFLPALGARAAAPIVVTTTVDEYAPATGDTGCALREAVQAANTDTAFGGCSAGSGADTIKLGAHTYMLAIPPMFVTDNSRGDLNILGNVAIEGVSAAATVVDGHSLDRIFTNLHNSLTIRRVTLQKGYRLAAGGAIFSAGPITITDSVLSANTSSGGPGGGLYAEDTIVTLQRVTVTGNGAGTDGGGIAVLGTSASHVTIEDSTIKSNTAPGDRGAGLYSAGTSLIVRRSLFTQNHGGNGDGLYNWGTADITNTTFTDNGDNVEGGQGGGIYNNATATLVNVTISGNRADNYAGDGGNIYNAGTLTARNTIVHEALTSGDCGGSAVTSLGHNLEYAPSSSSPCFSSADSTNVFADPKLGPLANNGGPTFTLALGSGSPAINAGVTVVGVNADERGVPRPAGPKPDIGAYERASCGGTLVDRVGTAGNDSLTGTSGADGMLGLGGNDTLKGGGGPDALCGGKGNDQLFGGPGNDNLFGGLGIDTCSQGSGSGIRNSCEH